MSNTEKKNSKPIWAKICHSPQSVLIIFSNLKENGN